jgi:hypothetical protein
MRGVDDFVSGIRMHISLSSNIVVRPILRQTHGQQAFHHRTLRVSGWGVHQSLQQAADDAGPYLTSTVYAEYLAAYECGRDALRLRVLTADMLLSMSMPF